MRLLLGFVVTSIGYGAVINGSFDHGLDGWKYAGSVVALDGYVNKFIDPATGLTVYPYNGVGMAVLRSDGVGIVEMETLLGFPPGTLTARFGSMTWRGSILWQDAQMEPYEAIEFHPLCCFPNYSFTFISHGSDLGLDRIGMSVVDAGIYRVGFGVLDGGDPSTPSYLLVDNPEPATGVLVALPMMGLLLSRRWRGKPHASAYHSHVS